MAANEWINGYLEAILGVNEEDTLVPPLREKGDFSPARYFVDEVVAGTDELALHKTWMRATATRDVQERSGRMENLCWRIWHLYRAKKKMEWDATQRLAKRRLEDEQCQQDVTGDMSEDLSEAENAGESLIPNAGEGGNIKISESRTDVSGIGDPHKERRLYIVMISLHGLVRGDNMELGRDSDTGGQVKYVVEFAKALAKLPEVYRVDLLTRQICSPEVDSSYGEPTEMLSDVSYDDDDEEVGQSGGTYIIRIPCGPREKYLRKELLWPYIQEFVDGALSHILNISKVLGEQIGDGQPVWPYVIHGHYADAGDIASLLSGALNVPMVLTGHSLGRNKLEQLLKQGRQSKEDINATYKIMRRIEAEELSLDSAELVITSTKQEIEQQWGLYAGFSVKLERTLRLRAKQGVNCYGRYMPTMAVIAPGMDFSSVVVPDVGDVIEDMESVAYTSQDGTVVAPASKPDPPLCDEILHFFRNPAKPIILALARADPKKNIPTLVKAFGESKSLRKLANLTLIMGNREDIDEMPSGNASVLLTVLKLIDKYNLYGEVAYPKHHKQSEVPDIYRLAAKTKGVFINPALVEPFGLTLIEAAAHGLPMVATTNGGPVDIHQALNNGLLVDPHDSKAIAAALYKLVSDRNLWTECRRNGLKNIHCYSWPEHCKIYLSRVALCRKRHPHWQNDDLLDGSEESQSFNDSLQDIHDISLRLSIDGDKSGGGSLNGPADLEKMVQDGCDGDENEHGLTGRIKRILEKMKGHETHKDGEQHSNSRPEKAIPERAMSLSATKAALLRKRKHIYVISVDVYEKDGKPRNDFASIIKEIFKALKGEGSARSGGFILSTALSAEETISFLNGNGIKLLEFDALVCSSGSELYYPTSDNGKDGKQLSADADYEAHIDYRWGEDGLRKTMQKFINSLSESGKKMALEEDQQSGSSHCLKYLVKDPSNVPTVEDFRERLRGRGSRCHVIYCRNKAKLHIVPLHASRAQALRYLFVRWGVDVANMTVFVGETGDTDYEELIPGLHKTVILKEVVKEGSVSLLHNSQTYNKDDVLPSDSPYIVTTEGGFNAEDIISALKKLS
ncbi:hypothetical protein GOP47_0026660 [Adiantum capillus-veneris]|nr:hypothetical protein GOP47_0026660 [Adiantum capillus-veneris]